MSFDSGNKNDKYQKHISKEVFEHYSNGYNAFQNDSYYEAAIWGSVFLESFLVEFMERLGISPPSKKDLNAYIQKIRAGNEKPLDDITKRCDDIRNIRNRLVHDTGLGKNTLQNDASSIYSNLGVILDWYCEQVAPISKSHLVNEETVNEDELIPVFISTLNADNEKQRYFLNGFMQKLKMLGVRPVRCTFNFYDGKDPLKRVREEILNCEALIVLGLERSNAYYIKDKEGSKKELTETHRKYTSGWLHLEAGMANALDKEIFVLCQKDLYSDGIFDRNWNTYPVLEFSELNENSRDFTMFFDYINAWAKVKKKDLKKEQESVTQ